jgi:pimeloyl-ACP methyl ester carboxylesterase
MTSLELLRPSGDFDAPQSGAPATPQWRELRVHGHRLAYRQAGTGPPVLLIHGIASTSAAWDPIFDRLAERYTVIAPDLFGHGASDKPPGDYSIGAYAGVIRDLILALGLGRVTVVGHSLGGGIAMQLAYQAPDLLARLVLLDAGGLGREVSVLLRAASLPAAPLFIRLATAAPLRLAGRASRAVIALPGWTLSHDVVASLDGFGSLSDRESRRAFLDTIRSSTGVSGQRASAVDKLYIAEEIPILMIWGRRDRIIPVSHAYATKRAVPAIKLEVIEQAGHFPQFDDPERVAAAIERFVTRTSPSTLDHARLGEILRSRGVVGDPVAA